MELIAFLKEEYNKAVANTLKYYIEDMNSFSYWRGYRDSIEAVLENQEL